MQTYLKTRSVWSQSFVFISLAASGLLIFVMMLGMWAATRITGLSLFELSDPSNWNTADGRYRLFLRLMLLMQFIGVFVAPVLVFAYLSDPKPARYLKLQKTPVLYYVLAVVAMVAAIPLVEYFGFLNQKIDFPNSIESWLKSTEKDAQQQIKMLLGERTVSNLLLNIVMVAGFAGIGEELFFRGVVQRLAIWGFKNVWLGIVVAALLFSALHMQFYGFFPRFFLGVLLGAIYWYSGSLWPAIAAHFFYDALLITLAYFNPSLITEEQTTLIPQPAMIATALVSAAAVAGLVLYMRRKSTADQAQYLSERNLEGSKPFTFEP